jgi:hypothetical protein
MLTFRKNITFEDSAAWRTTSTYDDYVPGGVNHKTKMAHR